MTKLEELVFKASNMKKLGTLKNHIGYSDLVSRTHFVNDNASISERLWHIQNNSYDIPKCPICGTSTKWRWEIKGYTAHCSSKCAHNDDTVLNKTKQTNLEKYGVDNPLKSEYIRQKGLDTILKRYNVKNAFWSKGREYNIQQLVQSKNKNIQQVSKINKLINDGLTQSQIGISLNRCQPRISKLLKRLQLKTKKSLLTSTTQQEIYDFLQDCIPNIEIRLNDTETITPYHLDILIPSINIGVEINGVYWHSELHNRNREYHIRKTNLCDTKQIQLIQIYDNEWRYKQNIVKSRLKNLIGVTSQKLYARKLKVVSLSTQTTSEFLEVNHIQGNITASIRYGLVDENNELYCCCTFGKSRYDKQYQYELLRYCNKLDTTVIGGAGKLLNHFVKNHKPTSIISYADRRWSKGNLYEQLGFNFSGNTYPNYYYFHRSNSSKLFSRQQFQKHKLQDKLEYFDSNLIEWENMIKNGYDRIWDCGHSKWILVNEV